MQILACKKISLRLDNDLVERLEDYANRERVPVSYVLRHLVIRFLEQTSPSPLLSPVVGGSSAPPAGGSGVGWRCLSDPEKLEVEFRETACSLFDGFIREGLDVKEATKRTNFALKAKKHPWATFDVVSKVLRDSGRFRCSR